MRNILLTIEYQGTHYHGWQIQPDYPTIQGAIQSALSDLTQSQITLIGASRTDAGVHALNQKAHFKTHSHLPRTAFIHGTNQRLPEDIRIRDATEVPIGFHAKRDSTRKIYKYWITCGATQSAIWNNYTWHIKKDLDPLSINQCLNHLLGSHDFSAFRAANCEAKSPIRRIDRARVSTPLQYPATPTGNRYLEIHIEGNAFLKHMVRNIVGTVVDVGIGKRDPTHFVAIFKSHDRTQASPTAPARGLFLADVIY